MVNYEPTARIYRKNSDAAARRVHELIDDGIRAGALRDVNGTFAAQVVALTIDAVQSGALLAAPDSPRVTPSPSSATSSWTDSTARPAHRFLHRQRGASAPPVSPYRCSRHGCAPAARRR